MTVIRMLVLILRVRAITSSPLSLAPPEGIRRSVMVAMLAMLGTKRLQHLWCC